MCYDPDFLDLKWKQYLKINNYSIADVDLDEFIRWAYRSYEAQKSNL